MNALDRRTMLAGLAAIPSAIATGTVAASASVSPRDQVNLNAAALAASMQALHGGEWRLMIDHDLHMVIVSRRLS
ncbi:hypothetical protein [Mesorhizobium sp. Cs1321R2N1]|uniref:hypothetical protein n=1 Tax=Mesorhizobium sp. Cs1321R2N1 TaxID=3015174 RepID=UPI00301CBF89